MATAVEWATRKAEAETALHKLMTGGRVVSLDGPDGTTVAFQPGDEERLEKYIAFCATQEIKAAGTAPMGPVYITPA